MKSRVKPALAIAIGLLLAVILLPLNAQGGSIFDDNWVPPAPAKLPPKPEPAPEPPTPSPEIKKPETTPQPAPEPAKPDAPSATPGPAAADHATQARRAVPAAAEQAKSRKLFKEIFAKELADRSAAARRELARKLLDQAATVQDSPTDEFVLLAAATDAGREGFDLSAVCKAADAMADAYDVDGLRLKADRAVKMTLRADSPAVSAENCRAGLKLADQLVEAEDYASATRLLQALRSSAPDAPTASQIQARAKEIDSQRISAERIVADLQKLKSSPDDPAANLAVGKYDCFVKDDWKAGLPLLAKGSDPALKAVAQQELAANTDSKARLALADAWLAQAAKATGTAQTRMQRRAVKCYDDALASLTGLEKISVEKKRGVLMANLSGFNGHHMTPDEIAARFTSPNKSFQSDGVAITVKTGNYDDLSTYVWLTNAETMEAFDFGFSIKAGSFQTLAIDIDGTKYRYTRGFQGGDTSRLDIMGKKQEFTKGGIKNGGEWAAIKVEVDKTKMTFFYNGASAGSLDLVTPMTSSSAVKVGFSSHNGQISVKDLYISEH